MHTQEQDMELQLDRLDLGARADVLDDSDSDAEYDDDFESESDDDDVFPAKGLMKTVVDMSNLLTKLHEKNPEKREPQQLRSPLRNLGRPSGLELNAIHEFLDETLTNIHAMAAEFDERERAAASIQKYAKRLVEQRRAPVNCSYESGGIITIPHFSPASVRERWHRLKTYVIFRSRILCASLSNSVNNYMLRLAMEAWKTKEYGNKSSSCKTKTPMATVLKRCGFHVNSNLYDTVHGLLDPSKHPVVLALPPSMYRPVAQRLAICDPRFEASAEPCMYLSVQELLDPRKNPPSIHTCPIQLYASVHQWLVGRKRIPRWWGTGPNTMYDSVHELLDPSKHPVVVTLPPSMYRPVAQRLAICDPRFEASAEPCMYSSVQELLDPRKNPPSVHTCQLYASDRNHLFGCSSSSSQCASPDTMCSTVHDLADSSPVTLSPSALCRSVETKSSSPEPLEPRSHAKRATCDPDVMESGDVRIIALPNADGFIELEIDTQSAEGKHAVTRGGNVFEESSLARDELSNWELV